MSSQTGHQSRRISYESKVSEQESGSKRSSSLSTIFESPNSSSQRRSSRIRNKEKVSKSSELSDRGFASRTLGVIGYDPCVGGSDLYTNVLGPSVDETFLVGLQTFLGFCSARLGEEEDRTEPEPEQEPESEQEPDPEPQPKPEPEPVEEVVEVEEEPPPEVTSLRSDPEEIEINNVTESQFSPQESSPEKIEAVAESVDTGTQTDDLPCPCLSLCKCTPSCNCSAGTRSTSTQSTDSQTVVTEGSRSVETESTADKSSDTSESSASTEEEMLKKSKKSSKTSQESRTSQTSTDKAKNPKRPCICKMVSAEITSEPSMVNTHCDCTVCNTKRRKQTRTCIANARSKCPCSVPSIPDSDINYDDEDDSVVMKSGQGFVKYAITKITKFNGYTTFEIMKSTKHKPKVMPTAVEGVFVLKNNKPP